MNVRSPSARRRAFTWWELVIVLAVLAILIAFLFPLFASSYQNSSHTPLRACQSNLKQIGLGIQQYIRDYDNRWPQPMCGKKVGWVNVLQPYLKSVQIFQCPSDPHPPGRYTTDYFYNTHLANHKDNEYQTPALIIATGDGVGNSPLGVQVSQLPASWSATDQSPARRHLDGANYGFADGHVKWYKPEKITTKPSSASVPTFALR